MWLLSAFKSNVPMGIKAWLLLNAPCSHTGLSASTRTHPRFVLKYKHTWVFNWPSPVSVTIGFTQVGSFARLST